MNKTSDILLKISEEINIYIHEYIYTCAYIIYVELMSQI